MFMFDFLVDCYLLYLLFFDLLLLLLSQSFFGMDFNHGFGLGLGFGHLQLAFFH